MTGHPTHAAPIDEVLDPVDRAIEVILSIFSGYVGFGFGSFILGVI